MTTPQCTKAHIIAQAYRDLAATFTGDTTEYVGHDFDKFLNELAHEMDTAHA